MKPETRLQLSWDCDEQLFRKELEDSDDMRLSIRLFNKCLGDKKQFCSDVPPGHALAKQCLEEHREELSDGCRWVCAVGCGRVLALHRLLPSLLPTHALVDVCMCMCSQKGNCAGTPC
jgi:hypothetical protein